MNEVFRPSPPRKTTRAAEGMERRAWSVAEIESMVRAGILADNERIELVGGEIVPMSPKGARHEWIKRQLLPFFLSVVPANLEVVPETTLHLDDNSFLEPDFCVFRKGLAPEAVTGPELLLAIEVADTSLIYDLGRKIGIYAAFGVREVWVINAKTLVTRVHRRLAAEGYAHVVDEPPSQMLTPALAPELAVRLADIGLVPANDED